MLTTLNFDRPFINELPEAPNGLGHSTEENFEVLLMSTLGMPRIIHTKIKNIHCTKRLFLID